MAKTRSRRAKKPGVATRVLELQEFLEGRLYRLEQRVESMTQVLSTLTSRLDLSLEIQRVDRVMGMPEFERSPLRVIRVKERLEKRRQRKQKSPQ